MPLYRSSLPPRAPFAISPLCVLAGTLCLVFLLPVAAQQNGNSGTESIIRTLEAGWAKAETTKDNVALDPILDSGLLLTTNNGVLLSKGDYLTKLREAGLVQREIMKELMAVHVFENSAIVVGIYREKGLKDGRAYLDRRRFVDTWAFKSGKWVCVAAAITPPLSR
jgi:hypothetical protein